MKSVKRPPDLPVFYDASGKRWGNIQIIVACFVAAAVIFCMIIIPLVTNNRRVAVFQDPGTSEKVDKAGSASVSQLESTLVQNNAPVIGSGPLVRVVSIQQADARYVAVEPFSGRVVSSLTNEEMAYLNGDAYAIQRYGAVEGRQIIITFDDGPDPLYTPQLLDMLSRESVRATFFTTGDNIVKYPDIARRIVGEGHTIANHTLTHIDFDFAEPRIAQQEIIQTQRIIAAATGQTTSFFRVPYGGGTDQSLRNAIVGILTAQQLGYVNASYTFDSGDWHFSPEKKPDYPDLTGASHVILVHDGGGDRNKTVSYVQELITRAKREGYTFAGLGSLYPQTPALVGPTVVEPADSVAYAGGWLFFVAPRELVILLFLFSLVTVLFINVLNVCFAIIHHIASRRQPSFSYTALVSVLIPAYNESIVLEKCVQSMCASSYKNVEIIIVDDGSTDNTWEVANNLTQDHANIRAVRQPNGGKASALNHAIKLAQGEIIVTVDADSVFEPDTISRLVRHFADPTVGAVAGVVRVGNIRGLLTLWQALEYAVSIAIERNSHALLGSVMIVPGACGAWRKSAVVEAGGLSRSTLAEDCELTLRLHSLGRYRIVQDNTAISYTEAPQHFSSLIKQRFRWTFGSIQSLWQHRWMIFNERFRFLGVFVMPYAMIAIMTQLLFWPLLLFVSIGNILSGNYLIILIYLGVTTIFQIMIALIGLLLARAPLWYILAAPFTRLIYGPVRMYVLYKTILTALRGSHVGWGKLTRTGKVRYQQEELIG